MKTPCLKILTILLATALVASCSDDDQADPKDFDPLSSYLDEAGFVPQDTLIDSGDYEFGISFRTSEPGTIESVVVKLPDDEVNVRVTVWDAETKTVLRTITLTSVEAHEAKTEEIEPLTLEADHDYMITFNSDDWYEYSREDEEAVIYPLTVGSITVLGYGYAEGTDQVFPDSFQDTYYAGDLSFLFKKED